MNAEIISIGTELLLGEIVDTNARDIARALRQIGVNLFFKTTVGDNRERIIQALRAALSRSDVVITTGGLGPTVDDVTREAVAAATGRPLQFREGLIADVEALFKRLGRKMGKNNLRQAYLPAGAIVVRNPVGTAPAFIVETERGAVISLPGVPREMRYLLSNEVLPYLQQRSQTPSAVIKAVVLHTVGIGESHIDALIADFETMSNPTVGLAAHEGETDVRVTAKAESEAAADTLLAPVVTEIRQRLGDAIFGQDDETLSGVIMALLQQHALQVVVARTHIAETVFAGWEALWKAGTFRWEAVDATQAAAQTAAEAETLATQAGGGKCWGLALTGVPGGGRFPEPGEQPGVTFIAFAAGEAPTVKVLPFNGEDEVSRGWIVRSALNMIRLKLLAQS